MPRIYAEQTRREVVRLRKKDTSWGEIVRQVRSVRNVSAARYIWKSYKATGDFCHRPSQGRPAVLTSSMKKRVDKALSKDPWLLPSELVTKLHLPVSAKTVSRYRSQQYRPVKGVPRPVLSARNRKARLNWAKQHLNDSFDDVVFTDEKSLFLFKVTRKAWVKQGADLPFRAQPSHPPRVQILGGISRKGPTALQFFEGYLTGVKHQENVDAIVPSIRRLYPDVFRYLQDNDSCHTDRSSLRHLEAQVPRILRLPAQSPDFNAIEHVWSLLDVRVAARQPRTVAELKKAVKKEWNLLTVDECNRIIDSIRPTLQAVVAAGGEHVTPAERRRYRA
eukprot:TRINITY_DN3734_c0_g1_i1.p2 TRINITY_DN3734_c0_g1~~TRINITY_DN3734_c0_g1_i1.p2  ORF type:complete len:334 (+),score=5.52 TRINITY_DN3734_c0_g1_i1:210-1211(+)